MRSKKIRKTILIAGSITALALTVVAAAHGLGYKPMAVKAQADNDYTVDEETGGTPETSIQIQYSKTPVNTLAVTETKEEDAIANEENASQDADNNQAVPEYETREYDGSGYYPRGGCYYYYGDEAVEYDGSGYYPRGGCYYYYGDEAVETDGRGWGGCGGWGRNGRNL